MTNNLTIIESKLIKCFDRPSIRIRIPRLATNKGKFPLIANWPNIYEPLNITQILAKDYNWGIRTGKQIGSYYFIVLDLDDEWAQVRLPVNRYVKSQRGIHIYCLVKELPKNSYLYDQDGQKIGDLLSLGKQAIGIGSIHSSGVKYSLKLAGKSNSNWFLKFATCQALEKYLLAKNIYLKSKNKSL